jgi:hypothetical protein
MPGKPFSIRRADVAALLLGNALYHSVPTMRSCQPVRIKKEIYLSIYLVYGSTALFWASDAFSVS